jgi:hypothetical protein
MKSKTVPHFVPWVRSLYAAIGHEQASRDALHKPSDSPSLSSKAKRPSPEPATAHPKPFFSQWFDTWRNRNEGVRP